MLASTSVKHKSKWNMNEQFICIKNACNLYEEKKNTICNANQFPNGVSYSNEKIVSKTP